ncbi:MAG TPA: biotin/lipoyl-containing protein, partial [Castellaniella sp.]|nr:biotin/lipoyl-containing protein [Castellaniella sp.]
MSKTIEIKVPDIGDFDAVEVIEVLVAAGDTIEAEQSLITVESDKASMEIPASGGGVVKGIRVKVGDKIKEGAVILELEPAETAGDAPAAAPAAPQKAAAPAAPEKAAAPTGNAAESAKQDAAKGASAVHRVVVPDIGDFDEVEVIELLVAVGDTIAVEQSLITVESDKASMEIPATQAGVVKSIKVKVGDKISQGAEILEVESEGAEAPAADAAPQAESLAASPEKASPAPSSEAGQGKGQDISGLASTPPARTSPTAAFAEVAVPLRNLPHASPSVRKFARELGVN